MTDQDQPLRSQASVWRCAVTALEYVTGVDRDVIAKEIGHDGGARPPSVTKRFQEGTHTFEDAFTYVGVLGMEIQWWAARRNLPCVVVESCEYFRTHLDPTRADDILHRVVSIPSAQELLEFIKGKVALITVPLPDVPNRTHLLAWIGDRAIDPTTGQRREITAADVLEVAIFQSVSAAERSRQLKLTKRECR